MNGAPPSRGLLETSLLIAIRSGVNDATDFALSLVRYHIFDMSELSATALLASHLTSEDRHRDLAFLRDCRVHRITAKISERAFRIVSRLPPPCGLTADDAIVAATAIEHKLPLYALNPTRFAAVPGLTALQPY